MYPSRFLFLGVVAGVVALAALARAEGVGRVPGAGPAQAVGAGEEPDAGPAVGEYVVIHHLTWLHRAPADDAERWADNRARADNQTEYLVFRVTGVRDGWLEVESLRPDLPEEPDRHCYGTLWGMADLGLRLWIRSDQTQRVSTALLELPQDDGTSARVAAGVVFVPGEVREGTMAGTLDEYGLSIPVRVPADRIGRSYSAGDLPPAEEGAGLVLDPGTAVRFAGSPVDLGGTVGALWLRNSTEDAVQVVTSCGRYRFTRDRSELTLSTPDPVTGSLVAEGPAPSSMDGVGMMMLIGTVGEGDGSVADLLSGEGEVLVGRSADPVIPAGTATTWPDGQPAGQLPRDQLLFGHEPVGENEGRACYRLTLGMFGCDDCADNVTLCFAPPPD